MTFDQLCDEHQCTADERRQLADVLIEVRRRRSMNILVGPPSKDELRTWVAAIAVGIAADEKTMSGLMQAAKVGWERGSGKRHRLVTPALRGS